VLVPEEGIASPLVLQGVPEQALGATRLDEGVQSLGETLWVRMADPEMNEFCACTGVEW
jgi:hypothetical protein